MSKPDCSRVIRLAEAQGSIPGPAGEHAVVVFRGPLDVALSLALRPSQQTPHDLKRAFRRLLARLLDESETSADFIVFSADGDHLEIVSGGTSETLKASVAYPGEELVPCPVFRGIRSNATVPLRKGDYDFVLAGVLENRSNRLPASEHLLLPSEWDR